jgi:hypothetical protein
MNKITLNNHQMVVIVRVKNMNIVETSKEEI